ncbi:MAG: TolC family protein [Rhodoferax sp.]
MVSHRRCSRAALAAAAAGLALALLGAPGMAQSQTATSAAPAAASTESLPALLARVLPADPQVRSAAALAEAAQERRKQSQSRMWPTIGASITRGGAAETELGRSVNRQTDRAEATVRWNVYNAGNDAAELRAATLEVQAAQEELRRAREEASTRIAEAYLDLLRLDSLVPKALERLQAGAAAGPAGAAAGRDRQAVERGREPGGGL